MGKFSRKWHGSWNKVLHSFWFWIAEVVVCAFSAAFGVGVIMSTALVVGLALILMAVVAFWGGLKNGAEAVKPPAAGTPKPRGAWEIPGARTQEFKLHEAACLLVEEEPAWPLPTLKAKDEYNELSKAVRTEQLDGPGKLEEMLSFKFGWRRVSHT